MIDRISSYIYKVISKNQNIDEDRKEIIMFGIVRIVEDVPKFIGIFIICFLLNILKELFIVTIMLALYKTFTGGVHAKTNTVCFFSSLALMLLPIYSGKLLYVYSENILPICIIIYTFAIYTILLYVPADVIEIPKVDKKLRKTLKIKSFIMLNIIILFTFFVIKDMYIFSVVISSIFYISLMTTRIIYKLFNNEYGFETYIKELS